MLLVNDFEIEQRGGVGYYCVLLELSQVVVELFTQSRVLLLGSVQQTYILEMINLQPPRLQYRDMHCQRTQLHHPLLRPKQTLLKLLP